MNIKYTILYELFCIKCTYLIKVVKTKKLALQSRTDVVVYIVQGSLGMIEKSL